MYKAVQVMRHGGPDMMRLIQRTELPNIQSNQVLVRIHAAAVNPVDTYIREGWHTASRPCPYIPGLDCGGEVISVGKDVTQFKVGDKVFSSGSISGTYASHGIFTEDQLFPTPKGFSYKDAACLGTGYFTALYSIQCSHPKRNPYVFVHGASGGVGSSIIKLLLGLKEIDEKWKGLQIAASCSSSIAVDYLTKLGVNVVVNRNNENYMDEIRKVNDGKGPDIIYEMLANKNLNNDMNVINQNGEIFVIGNRGSIEFNPRDLMTKGINMKGIMLFSQTREERLDAVSLLNKLAERNLELTKPLIHREYSLEQAKEAHIEVIEHSQGTMGRLIINTDLLFLCSTNTLNLSTIVYHRRNLLKSFFNLVSTLCIK